MPGISRSNVQVKSVGASDHRMIFADFVIDINKKRGKGRFKCNAKVHDRPDFLQEVEDAINTLAGNTSFRQDPSTWLKLFKKKIAQIYTRHSRLRLQEIRQQQENLELLLEQAENRLISNPHNNILKHQFQNAKDNLKAFLITKTKEKMVKERYNNFGPNYFKTKEFFRKFKEGQRDAFIEKLKDEHGRTQQTPEAILKTAKDFYDALYRKERVDLIKQERFLNLIQKKITDANNEDLNRNITVAEVIKAIKATKAGGSPGLDGISIDFYK